MASCCWQKDYDLSLFLLVFQGIKVYICLKNAKKRNVGNRGSLENILLPPSLKTIEPFEKAIPFQKTIEVFGKSPPVPFPCYRGGDREGDPFIQCPLPSSLF